MKKTIQQIGIVFCAILLFMACEKEITVSPNTPSATTEQATTITLIPTFSRDILQETEIEPMSRAAGRVTARIWNSYKIVIIKKVDSQWIIDTVIKNSIDPTIYDPWESKVITVYDTASLPPIHLALRPGTYKAAFFLNAGSQNWNEDLKPGLVVSDKDDITPQDELPVAYTYEFQTDIKFLDFGLIMLVEAPYAAYTSFTIEKNDTLQNNGNPPIDTLYVKRKATRFRYLLTKDTAQVTKKNDKNGIDTLNISFRPTTYSLTATFTTTEATPFCQGLNILGGGYYPQDSLCTALNVRLSTSGRWYTSPQDGKEYQLVTIENSTYRSYHFLMDERYPEGIPYKIKNIEMSGQSGETPYRCKEEVSGTFYLNTISGITFKLSNEEGFSCPDYDPDHGYYFIEDPTIDAVEAFNPFFELNPKP